MASISIFRPCAAIAPSLPRRCALRVAAVASPEREQQQQTKPKVAQEGRSWSPSSWRDCPIVQQPTYPDADAHGQVLQEIASYPPLVFGECQQQQKQQDSIYTCAPSALGGGTAAGGGDDDDSRHKGTRGKPPRALAAFSAKKANAVYFRIARDGHSLDVDLYVEVESRADNSETSNCPIGG